MTKHFIKIVSAVETDRKWVEDIMETTLQNYYGGNHRAHAKRIFDAHINGGKDKIGFFSHEQKMFLAKEDNLPIGMIHIVGKKQSTYKISPLIIDPSYRGKYGVGSMLLNYVEDYALKYGVRQIYCTVAEQNISALQFFIKKGFICAGESESHYKDGIKEKMFYKPLKDPNKIHAFDKHHISVLPLSEANEASRWEIRKLLLEKLPKSFSGVDDNWVDALFQGYDRRHTQDINSKYKLIFVALDNLQRVVGVAAATPKKGSPIKIMPFIAHNDAAFAALLTDIPYQLAQYGHKLYIHLNPTPLQITLLQKLNWKINALMPEAYNLDVVTQQWSIDIGEKTNRSLRVKDMFVDYIKKGDKDLEVRVGYETIKKIALGEYIEFHAHSKKVKVKIKDIRIYKSFLEMLKFEPYERIVPGLTSEEEVYRLLRTFYPVKKEKLGVYVFSFELA